MTLHGVDVSSYQPDWIPDKNDDFVFIKASEGTTYRNPERTDQASRARKAGLVVGWYHFLHHGSIQAQADYFLNTSGIQAGDLLVCDWEKAGCTTADKDQWIKAVQAARPTSRVGLYCNTNWWLNTDTSGFCGDFLWIAAYQSSKPNLSTPITFWQYTDKPLDQNHGYFDSVADLQDWAGGRDSESTEDTATIPVYPTSDAIRTPYGQKGSSWASGYHQGDDWHRNAGQAEIGDPIYAVASGKIIYAGDARQTDAGWGAAFGIHVLNQWDAHGRTSIDAHMSKLHVKTGDRVQVGQLIGEKGATGNVSGPHDHHEQHTGTRWTDPDVKPIYPGKPGKQPAGGKDDFDMAEHVTFTRTQEQGVAKINTDEWLWIDDDKGTSFITYPAKVMGGIIDLTISGLKSGDYYQLYPCAVDVKDGGQYVIRSSDAKHPIKFAALPDGGWVRQRAPFDWVLGDQEKGYKYRGLRFMIRATSLSAKIEHVSLSGWVVKT